MLNIDSIEELVVSDEMGCARMKKHTQSNKKITCWGHQVGTEPIEKPNNLASIGFSDLKNLSLGGSGSSLCGLSKGKVYCFGTKYSSTSTGKSISELKNVKILASSKRGYHSCAIKKNGSEPFCWVNNTSVSWPSYPSTFIYDIPELWEADMLSLGDSHGCGVTNNKIYCWGKIKKPANFIGKITAIESGSRHSCVISDSKVICWGSNSHGQVDVPKGLDNVSEISLGTHHSCSIVNNNVTCWGDNSYGQIDVPLGLINPRMLVLPHK